MTEDRTLSLITAARSGDRGAYDELGELYRPRLAGLIRGRLGEKLSLEIDVDDILQETLLRGLRSITDFEDQGPDSLFRWLGGISNNVIREAARKSQREVFLLEDNDPAASGVTASRQEARSERFDRLQDSLSSLSSEHQRVIRLARLERRPIKEVAQEMGRSPEAITQLLWRALKKLRESFGSTDSFHLPDRELRTDSETSDDAS